MKFGRSLPPVVTGTLAVLRLLPVVSRVETTLLAIGVLVRALLPIGLAVVSGLLVGSVPAALQAGPNSPAAQATLTFLILAAGLIVASRLLEPVLRALASVLGRAVDRHLQERVMGAVSQPTGIGHLEEPVVLDLIQNAQGIGNASRPPGEAVPALASLLPSWLQALGSAAILLAFHWWLALIWLVMLPSAVYYLQREYLQIGAVASGQAAATRRASYERDLALAPAAAKEFRLWGMLDWLGERVDREWRRSMAPIWQARRPWHPLLWLTTGAVALVNLVSFGLLAWAAHRGQLDLSALAVFTQAVLGANGYRAFDDANAQLAYAAVSVPSLLALESQLARSPAAKSEGVLPPDSPREAIRFEGVRFRYPGQTGETLAGLDLAIPAGRSLAIVGANGAGKTTLLKLLCRFYDPTDGRVTVDGVDLRAYDGGAWRQQIAAIFQDFLRYPLSARENVGFGAPDQLADLARLRAAAERAGALDLIESLPKGWDTVLSRQYTGGVDLSGGQWQRVALARALFAVEAGARVLILDEPTASLDVRAEADLYERFLELTRGLTTILISHRFSTVRLAERICVLADGKIVEAGSHEALIARGGHYATLFALQSSRFVASTTGGDE